MVLTNEGTMNWDQKTHHMQPSSTIAAVQRILMHLVASPALTFHMTTELFHYACVLNFYKRHVNNLMYHSVHLVEWNNWLVILRGYCLWTTFRVVHRVNCLAWSLLRWVLLRVRVLLFFTNDWNSVSFSIVIIFQRRIKQLSEIALLGVLLKWELKNKTKQKQSRFSEILFFLVSMMNPGIKYNLGKDLRSVWLFLT